MRDIEQFYNTQIEEMPMNVADLVRAQPHTITTARLALSAIGCAKLSLAVLPARTQFRFPCCWVWPMIPQLFVPADVGEICLEYSRAMRICTRAPFPPFARSFGLFHPRSI